MYCLKKTCARLQINQQEWIAQEQQQFGLLFFFLSLPVMTFIKPINIIHIYIIYITQKKKIYNTYFKSKTKYQKYFGWEKQKHEK